MKTDDHGKEDRKSKRECNEKREVRKRNGIPETKEERKEER